MTFVPTTKSALKHVLIGGGIGAGLSSGMAFLDRKPHSIKTKDGIRKETTEEAKKRTRKAIFSNAATGALSGAAVGFSAFGFRSRDYIRKQRQEWQRKQNEEWQRSWDDFNRRYSGSGGNSGSGRSGNYTPPPPAPKPNGYHHSDFFKNYGGIDHTKIKTKKEAKAHYRAAAQKHHPDAGGSADAFKKMQAQWEDVERSDWFTKLAAYGGSIIKLAMYHMQ